MNWQLYLGAGLSLSLIAVVFFIGRSFGKRGEQLKRAEDTVSRLKETVDLINKYLDRTEELSKLQTELTNENHENFKRDPSVGDVVSLLQRARGVPEGEPTKKDKSSS